MPSNLVHSKHEEKLWAEAKAQAEKEYPDATGDRKWKIVNGIYQRMRKHAGGGKMPKTEKSLGLFLRKSPWRDKLHGGKGDKKKPEDFDPEEVRLGMEQEMEHTSDRHIAEEIALDQLSEDPRYYSKMKAQEKSFGVLRAGGQLVPVMWKSRTVGDSGKSLGIYLKVA